MCLRRLRPVMGVSPSELCSDASDCCTPPEMRRASEVSWIGQVARALPLDTETETDSTAAQHLPRHLHHLLSRPPPLRTSSHTSLATLCHSSRPEQLSSRPRSSAAD